MKQFLKHYLIPGFAVAIIIFTLGFFVWYQDISHLKKTDSTVSSLQQQTHFVSYSGKNGYDALTLLREHASLALDSSGLVTTINGYTAQNTKHEYWAFYVNGKMAQVGPKGYMTKNTDTISWKIERY